jgi:serine/threonine protein kinase
VSLRIRWQTDEGEGAFPLRTRSLHLVFFDGAFDVASQLGEGQDGLTLGPPDSEGKIDVQAHGDLEFVSGEKHFPRVRLPIGGVVGFACAGWQGQIRADGKAPINDPLVGTELGGYRILGRLGAGAVGVVYRSLQINLDREVALKLLDAEIGKRPAAVASFRHEAQAAGRLTHPHVVQVYDVGEDQGRQYYTMEVVPGGDLEDRLDEGGPMPWQEACAAARDCCRALAFAEEHGLVHRDVKPENLMVAPGGVVKLADLGLAATRGMLDTEAAGGTPHFMAPESIGTGKVDHRSDLYSVGCTLFRLLTGETVFSGSTVKDILRAHRDAEPRSLRELGVQAPRELDDLLASLLAKDPEERPQHATEVAEELEAILEARASHKGLLIGLPILLLAAVGAWIAFGPKTENQQEPNRVVEYIERQDTNDADERARASVRAAYFEALAKPAAEGVRLAALQQFLLDHPDAEQAAEAQAEITRLEVAAAALAESDPTVVETEAERQAREALEAATAAVDSALRNQHYAEARRLARTGPTATAPAMIALAETVDAQASAQFDAWESEHAAALDQQDWKAAASTRGVFRTSLSESAPVAWIARVDALHGAAEAALAEADAQRFRSQRVAFLASVDAPVRGPLANLEMSAVHAAWQAAVAEIEHPELRSLAQAEGLLLERAAAARADFDARVRSENLEIEEYTEHRKADVLGLGPEGLRLRVQIRGERVERTDPWSVYRSPQLLRATLLVLAPQSGAEEQLAALYYVLACDQLANALSTLSQASDAAAASALRKSIEGWSAQQPHPDRLPLGAMNSFQAAIDLCLALEAGDDYLALNRVEDLQARFGLLSVWTSGGESSWGLKP